ncbi:hypothetical protein BN2476_1340002 [Paraburkholderia piptadeniae]|uniref:ParB/Sulfiredoxin domain-containing protein n=2 Tax=Burkholderiaceae TaxID=119060 RepID=A0A1N7SWJ0_9BURK|nr:hypothetical protein BN2476_1340002 [Paraburkholderia piptadeniae]
MQNLLVHEIKGRGKLPKLSVCAGQRRLAALDLLFSQGRITTDYQVPMLVVSDGEALQTAHRAPDGCGAGGTDDAVQRGARSADGPNGPSRVRGSLFAAVRGACNPDRHTHVTRCAGVERRRHGGERRLEGEPAEAVGPSPRRLFAVGVGEKRYGTARRVDRAPLQCLLACVHKYACCARRAPVSRATTTHAGCMERGPTRRNAAVRYGSAPG